MSELHEHIYVIGAGGHGKVAVRAAQQRGWIVDAVFDDDSRKRESVLCAVPVVGEIRSIARRPPLPTLIAIGDNRLRLTLADELHLEWAGVVHPSAVVDADAQIGTGVLVLAGVVIQVDAFIGPHAIINNNATIEHDCRVGAGAHISCGACLAGDVRIGIGTLVGAGAVVLPGINIGDFAIIGAGAVVTRDVPDGATAVGVPARFSHSKFKFAA